MERPKAPKAPRTAAGAEIIESILAAAEQVIESDGIKGFTTNRVAERAGVSVGSLYQYFPSKESVLAELARRHERRTEASMVEILVTSSELSLEATATRVVDALLLGIGGLQYRRALLHEVPDGWTAEIAGEVDADVRETVRAALERRTDVRRGEHALLAWVVAHAVEGAVEAAVRTNPDLIGLPAFRSELIELVMRYLRA